MGEDFVEIGHQRNLPKANMDWVVSIGGLVAALVGQNGQISGTRKTAMMKNQISIGRPSFQ